MNLVQVTDEIVCLTEKLLEKRIILQGMELRLELGMHERNKHQGYLDTTYVLDEKRKLEAEIAELKKKRVELHQKIIQKSVD